MWPVIYTFMRSNARFIVFPAALVIGGLGYAIESMVSSKYTPFSPSIQEIRIERLTSEEALRDSREVKTQRYENVLDKNLSASLSRK